VKSGLNQPKKVVKIDLDKMSSGSDGSSSESSDEDDEVKDHNFSQHDSEINNIKINPETASPFNEA
jgi:hypothetical protein